RVLTAAAAMCGQTDVAQQALQDLGRVQPNVSLAWLKTSLPIQDDTELEHYIEGFRKAGLN
ncbi:MAG TPA: hypothetical protein VEH02_02025, partial [Pseudolabrys sp.]|nr:hypothetical protein [Pseudolabrys sp.]